MLDERIKRKILTVQRNEITEYLIYKKLAESVKDIHNSEILEKISNDELGHYNFWKKYTNQEIKPAIFKVWAYFVVSKILGITFGIKLMEKGEKIAYNNYNKISKVLPEAKQFLNAEYGHEMKLIALINEEKLKYIGSIVLGINDALVELIGALAGLTLALQNSRVVAVAGLITGIAASFSMGASEYLSTKSEGAKRSPLKSSLYTGAAYILAVFILISPYLFFDNLYLSLILTISLAILIIFFFTFYISVAVDTPFGKRFFEMLFITLSVATLTFVIGFFIRKFLNIGL